MYYSFLLFRILLPFFFVLHIKDHDDAHKVRFLPDISSLDENLIKKMCEFMQPLITDTIREEIQDSLEPMISSLRRK